MNPLPDNSEISSLPRYAQALLALRLAQRFEGILLPGTATAIQALLREARELVDGARKTADALSMPANFRLGHLFKSLGLFASKNANAEALTVAYHAVFAIRSAWYGEFAQCAHSIEAAIASSIDVAEYFGEEAVQEIAQQIENDFQWLRGKALEHDWSDSTPMPRTVMNEPLWLDGVPSWLSDDSSATECLTVLVEPGTASRSQIADFLSEISLLYKQTGGSGIVFTATELQLPVVSS